MARIRHWSKVPPLSPDAERLLRLIDADEYTSARGRFNAWPRLIANRTCYAHDDLTERRVSVLLCELVYAAIVGIEYGPEQNPYEAVFYDVMGQINPALLRRHPVPPAAKVALDERDGHCCSNCGYCGRWELEVDHILPVAAGGSDDLANLQWLCRICNQRKRDLLPDAWAQISDRVAVDALLFFAEQERVWATTHRQKVRA